MIKHYIIDGNNLIAKLAVYPEFKKVSKNNSRSKLAFMIERYFNNKKVSVTVHYDGYKKDAIKTEKIRIDYSDNRTADEWIKHEIMVIKNPRTVCVVSSDNNILEFAKVNSCKTIKSEKFAIEITRKNTSGDEEKAIKSISESEIKKLFGVD